MKLILKTAVDGPVVKVFAGFDRTLFTALSPPLMPVTIERFDGCRPGDEVHLKLWVGRWESVITAREEHQEECFFIDQGRVLPFPFTFWQHKHQVRRLEGQTWVIDEIDFETKNPFLTRLTWPLLWCMFAARKPVYRRYFREKKG